MTHTSRHDSACGTCLGIQICALNMLHKKLYVYASNVEARELNPQKQPYR